MRVAAANAGARSVRAAVSAAAWLGVVLACAAGDAPAPPPNIVLLIADDLGHPDYGFMGSEWAETPTLDSLAREGMLFRYGFNTSSVCRPSLRTLLTGLQPLQIANYQLLGRREGKPQPQPERLRGLGTLPRALAERGYVSFQAGKYWEADYALAGFTDGMQRPGDDPVEGGAGRLFARDGSLAPVAEFLDAHRGRPFFLWFAPMLPHWPHDADARFRARYEGRGLAETAVGYYANVTRFDAAVASLLELLEERGLREDTLLVFLADNGWDQPSDADLTARFPDGTRGKGTMHEIGWRTPLIFSWPGRLSGGRVSDALVSTVDLFPTLLELAGAELPPGRSGYSLVPTLEGGAPPKRKRVIGEQRASRVEPGSDAGPRQHQAFLLRSREWWYIWFRDRGVEELYAVSSDSRAESNVAAQHPDVLLRYQRAVGVWEARMRKSAALLGAPP